MYERAYGYQYEKQQGMTNTEIAKLIREDIKTAIREGLLPAHWKYSVRSRSFAGGCSIDVRIKNCADAWQACDGTKPGSKHYYPDGTWVATGCPDVWCKARALPEYAHAARTHYVLTPEAMAANMTLERIHGAYNHDGSDIMTDYFDVNYYGTVDFQDRPGERGPLA